MIQTEFDFQDDKKQDATSVPMEDLNLGKPLCFFDLETTGVQVGKDRIIEICILRVETDNSTKIYTQRFNPQMPIPEESYKVHGISDEMVKDAPLFEQKGHEIVRFFADADLAGYNSNKFDIPLLVEEFLRVGINFEVKNRRLIDVQNIFHKMESRTLSAASKFYLQRPLYNAHSAEADTIATYEIFKAQIARYKDVEIEDKEGRKIVPIVNDMAKLAEFTKMNNAVDLAGHIVRNAKGIEVFNFGKYKGCSVMEIFEKEPSYYAWMMDADFPLYTKKILSDIRLRSKK